MGLLAAVWVVTLLVPDGRPESLDTAEKQVLEVFDRIEGEVPTADLVSTDDSSEHIVCANHDDRLQSKLERRLSVSDSLDRVAWARELIRSFDPDEGWVARASTLGQNDDLRVRIVGRDLLVFNVYVSDESGTTRITIRSTTECSGR
ncbi:hypothetical protein BJ978_001426 [Agromyces terreus]|uniref:Uncharacterized protein n=1 Tax=Agromyces terreus TaxID=424795 RepID=A0A9X2KBV2_9MICO|nr:hypothetical protein [Agromyces terreus]MCP2370736.1 hypothetical protein [Agromyces terreus]MCP2370750.1 hypothetical protein [Agromyces terreus]